ncbi:bifunctional adenosylcobinamide kinase/adenosylcobinamide-phosphate guanylyltransferase [Sporosarcina highlanderae]|uniref:Bifunctional adenosylcobinamide kinase/adenosylcobinamide-phosphate guanylyltransferase n=1 Tax=Sporosarcina highlanderae TaxID=3035916 RepID=A0ABT8JLL5_9BACL|nr:bifunctional adenosylcobinamide kinase/adenosylcobinamide-phosphate guanylyltransferase [Sporosarcina highlanderae]MDN4606036.1 bifunctional adenosylcobinamide kinase/adenosylcobinamide-phosphate guanylyltransferase [Sporosarcina highlanderae]
MRVIIGGAHNGKRDYVKRILVDVPHHWVDCSVGELEIPSDGKVVVDRIEQWLAQTELPEADAVEFILKSIEDRDVIFILTDVGRGIVPMDAKQRALRDACGRLYQQLIAQADEVTRIWYGLPQTLKKIKE